MKLTAILDIIYIMDDLKKVRQMVSNCTPSELQLLIKMAQFRIWRENARNSDSTAPVSKKTDAGSD